MARALVLTSAGNSAPCPPSAQSKDAASTENLDWMDAFFHPGPPLEPGSDITTVEFHQSSIDTASFYCCIEKIKSLQKFTYDVWRQSNAGIQTWEPRGIVGVLQLFANRSVVRVELVSIAHIGRVRFRREEPFVGSLRAFEVLETMRLETVMLYKEVEGIDDRTPNEKSESIQLGPPEIIEHDWAEDVTLWWNLSVSLTFYQLPRRD